MNANQMYQHGVPTVADLAIAIKEGDIASRVEGNRYAVSYRALRHWIDQNRRDRTQHAASPPRKSQRPAS